MIDRISRLSARLSTLADEIGEFKVSIPSLPFADEFPTEKEKTVTTATKTRTKTIPVSVVDAAGNWQTELERRGYAVESFDYSDDGIVSANANKNGSTHAITKDLFADLTGASAA